MRTAAFIAALVLAAPAFAQEVGPAFTLESRPDVQSVTVPVLRPATPDHPMAFDVVPNGTPAPHGALGMAWVHVCDTDVTATPTAPMNCAAMAADDEAVRFGSSSYGNEPARPIEFLIGNRVVGRLTPNGLRVGNFDTTKVMNRLNALTEERARQAKRIRQLERELDDLRAVVRELARR